MELIVISIFEIYSVTIDVGNLLVHLPDISMQVRKKSVDKLMKSFTEVHTTQKMVVSLFQQVMVPTYALTNGAVEATPAFEKRDAVLVSPALVNLTEGKTMLQNSKLAIPTSTHTPSTLV